MFEISTKFRFTSPANGICKPRRRDMHEFNSEHKKDEFFGKFQSISVISVDFGLDNCQAKSLKTLLG